MDEVTRKIPKRALLFAAEWQADPEPPVNAPEEFTLYPFQMLARTKGVANHPFWGRCIHDFAGMLQLKPSVSVDYCHDAAQVIGFADKIEVGDEGLRMAGAFVSTKEGDRAEEVALKRKAGVPWEASIMTSWENLVIETIPDGYTADVNGMTVEGPITVFRTWELWGVAVCPYGTDAGTNLQFAASLAGDVSVSMKGSVMTKPAETNTAKNGADFLSAFGAKGGVWFAEGKTFEQALGIFSEEVKKDNEAKDGKINELSTKIGELSGELDKAKTEYAAELEKLKTEHSAEVEKMKTEYSALAGGKPLSFNPPPNDQTPGNPAPQQFAGLTPGMAKFANAIKMPAPKA